jgi:hypothetical protein
MRTRARTTVKIPATGGESPEAESRVPAFVLKTAEPS